MRKFLLVQNPGVAPIESYTFLGVSLTNDCGVEGTIGQFASGAKHAICLLLRLGLPVVIYCGKLRLEFFTEKRTVADEDRSKDFDMVWVNIKGEKADGGYTNTKKELGWTKDFGNNDWTEVNMALREFISNSIDRTLRAENEFLPAIKDGRLAVEVVNENQLRAKDGYTRVYVEANEDVLRFYGELPVRFLHFSDHPERVHQRILPKGRGLDDSRCPMIYKQGVFVRQVRNAGGEPVVSLYDYNFGKSFKLDECRNANDYDVRRAAARCLTVADTELMIDIFRALMEHKTVWEATFDTEYLSGQYDWCNDDEGRSPEERKKIKQKNWHEAWDKAAGGQTVMCKEGALATEQVCKKGHVVATVKAENWYAAVEHLEAVPTATKFLDEHEQKGREILDPTPFAIQAVETVWGWLQMYGKTRGKPKPPVGCFRDSTDAGAKTLGFYHPKEAKVYFNESIATGGVCKMLLQSALEELSHYVTGSTDCSRDFQDFLVEFVVEVCG